LYLVGAAGTGGTAASPACRIPGSGLVAAWGALSGCATAQGEGRPGNQSGDAKAGQDLFQVADIHECLLFGYGLTVNEFPGAGTWQANRYNVVQEIKWKNSMKHGDHNS